MKRGRILSVASNFPRWPGDSTTPFVYHLALDLLQLDWEVVILAPHAPGAAFQENMNGLQVERFRYMWPVSQQTICYQGGMLINLRKNPAEFLKVPVFLAIETMSIAQRLLTGKFDLLHTHCILPQGFAGILAAKLTGTPHVTTVHGSDVFSLNNAVFTPFKRFSLKHADAVTVNSSATARAVNTIAPQLDELHQIPMGASLPPGDLNAKSSEIKSTFCQEGTILLIFVGRVVKEKGLEELLRAIKLLVQKNLPVHALIVGEGQDRDSFERLRDTLGLQSQVTFTGWVDPDAIPYYLAAGDVFVSPSWFEGQGLTVIEAMLAGTPVVATGVGGIIDSIEHEKTGLLVPVHAPEAIAAAVERLLTDQSLSQEMAARARQNASAKFSRQASAEAFSKLYQTVINKKK